MNMPTALWQRVLGALLGLALLVTHPGIVRADQQERPVLTAGYIHFPPIAYADEHGNAQGAIIDLTNELAAASGFRIEWKQYPINRIYRYLDSGDIDFWPGSPDIPALRDFTVQSGALDISVKLCAFALEGTPVIRDMQELAGRDLVLIRGYTYREQLNRVIAGNPHKPIVAPNHTAAMELLLRGRAQYLVSYGHPMQQAMASYPLQGARCDQLDEWPLVYVISLRSPHAEQLADALDNAFVAWRAAHPERPLLPGAQHRMATVD